MIRRAATIAATLAAMLLAGDLPAASGASTAEGSRAALVLGPGSEVWMEGKSTVHDWESHTTSVGATFTRAATQADPAGAAAIEGLVRANGVRGLDVRIPVATLHSGKPGLDKNLLKSLQAERYPAIEFRMERYSVVSPETADTLKLSVEGLLTVAGTGRHVVLVAGAWKGDKGEWIDGTVPLDMSAFGIKPPTMMLGALKVNDRIVIHYRLLLVPDPGAQSPRTPTER